jgi:putative ABC transport system permease protein
MLVRVATKEDVASAQQKVERIFEKRFGKDQKDVAVSTSEQILARIGAVLGLLQLFLAGVASISLLVGGIGIMNTMVMAVLERTQEIGVMKAIGATNTLILSIFLLEAGMIGLVGGLLGVTIGYVLSFGIGSISSVTGFAIDVQLDFGLIAFALVFSMLVGMISGLIPARNAAGLEPVVALRGAE